MSISRSNKRIVVSPRRKHIRTPNMHRDRETANIIEESITKKRKTNERIEDKETGGKYHMTDTTTTDTTTTIGTESQTELSSYDPKNGDDSKQNHDVQEESEDPHRQ